jgi:hypothetical protein
VPTHALKRYRYADPKVKTEAFRLFQPYPSPIQNPWTYLARPENTIHRPGMTILYKTLFTEEWTFRRDTKESAYAMKTRLSKMKRER